VKIQPPMGVVAPGEKKRKKYEKIENKCKYIPY